MFPCPEPGSKRHDPYAQKETTEMIDRNGRETITIKKTDLLAKLLKNRAAHIAQYKQTFEGFEATYVEELGKMLAAARATPPVFRLHVNLVQPVDHTREYDSIIMQLEMSVGDEATISLQSFQHYVMDEWDWKGAFVASNNFYSGKAGPARP